MRGMLGVLLTVAVAGCAADYLNHYDTVSLAAGDAQKANRLLHTSDPFNPASYNTKIETDGRRTADVVDGYRGAFSPTASSSGSPGTGPCQKPGDRDAAGNVCGGRAASEKPGGRTGNE